MNVSRLKTCLLTAMVIVGCGDGVEAGRDDLASGEGSGAEPADLAVNEGAAPEDAVSLVSGDPAGEWQKVRHGSLVFDVRTAGPLNGTPVILLHGFPENAREWDAQIPALAAAGYRVIAPDQRGYSDGARPANAADYGVSKLVSDVLAIADALGAKRFHLVGHDWGAIVAWNTAAQAPERILTLNPISVPHPAAFALAFLSLNGCQRRASSYVAEFASQSAEAKLRADDSARLRSMYGALPPEKIEAYVQYFSGPALTGGLNWYRAGSVLDGTSSATAGSISVPTMFMWSDHDTAICRDGAVRTRRFVKGPYRFEVFENVSHWIPELASERVNALLLSHFSAYPNGR